MVDRQADVVVIGCGATGLLCALELAHRGARVVAVDRAAAGSQTSRRAAGQSVVVQDDAAVGALMGRSLRCFHRFAEAWDGFELHAVGSIKLACSDWAAAQLQRETQRAAAAVVPLALDRVRELAPFVATDGVLAATAVPDDFYFDPPAFLDALVSEVRRAGVELVEHEPVTGIEQRSGRACGVRTASSRIAADAVVVAAGPWSTGILTEVGVRLPTTLVRHQFTVRGPHPSIRPTMPVVRVVDDAVYVRPDADRLVMGTYEPRPLVLDPARLPEVLELDDRAVERAPAARRLFGSALRWPLVEARGGVVAMTPDGRYVVDRAGPDGLYVVAGCNVRGLTVAPAIAQDLAAWITGGHRPVSLEPFRHTRFPAAAGDASAVREGNLRRYEALYRDAEAVQHVRRHG